jgi:hypothetical protein
VVLLKLYDLKKIVFSIVPLSILISNFSLIILAHNFYNLPWQESIGFELAVFYLFYIPGNLFLRFMKFEKIFNHGSHIISLATGTVVIPILYFAMRKIASPDLILQIFFVICGLYWSLDRGRNFLTRGSLQNVCFSEHIALAVLISLVIYLLHLSHFTDIVLLADGFKIRTHYMTETIFHQGIINALRDAWPPQNLYASGRPDMQSYHLNLHLQFEMINRFFHINTLYLTYFYMPFMYFSLLVSSAYVFVRQIGGNILLALLASILIFGSDFSFIPALTLESVNPQTPWTLYFSSTIWGMFTLNGVLPAFIALFLYLIFLYKFFVSRNHLLLLPLILVSYGAFGFKSSMGVQLAAVSLFIGLLMTTQEKDRSNGLYFIAASIASLTFMVIDLIWFRTGLGGSHVSLDVFNKLYASLKLIGIPELSKSLYPIFLILFLIASLGVRTIGLMLVHKFYLPNKNFNWFIIYLFFFVLGGYVLSEMMFLGSAGGHNNAGMFFAQSLMAAWFLLFVVIVNLVTSIKHKQIVIGVCILLAMPTTVQFLNLRNDSNYIRFGADEVTVIDYLINVDSGSVVLHPLNLRGPSLASNFAGKASVLNVFRSFVTEADGINERAMDIQIFFHPKAKISQRSIILKKYKVDYVYMSPKFDKVLNLQPELKLILSTDNLSLYKSDL